MMMVVTVKYVLTMMRADNGGEGGSLALLALIKRTASKAGWPEVHVGAVLCADARYSCVKPAP